MSLQTDRIFYLALASSRGIVDAVDGNIYNTAIALPDEDLDNVPCPYIIVTFDGMVNDTETKDDRYEGSEDRVNIGVEITHHTRDQLAALVEAVRGVILEYFRDAEEPEEGTQAHSDWELIPQDYDLSASPVSYDPDKPCYFIKLSYACVTNK